MEPLQQEKLPSNEVKKIAYYDNWRKEIAQYMEVHHQITKEDEEYAIGNLLADRLMELDQDTRKLIDIPTVNRFVNYLLEEKIYIDNVFYSLIARQIYGKVTLVAHERLTYLIAKYQEENNVMIGVEVFTEKAYEYLRDKNIRIKGTVSMAELPIDIAAEKITYDNIKFLYIYTLSKNEHVITRPKIYNTDDILAMARRGDKKETKGSWFNPKNYTDTIEMIKKTAIRNYMKYYIYPRND